MSVFPVPIIVAVIADIVLSIVVGLIASRDERRIGFGWFFLSLIVTPILACLFLAIITLQDNYASSRSRVSAPIKTASTSTDSDNLSGSSSRSVYVLNDGTGKWECPDCGAINPPSGMGCNKCDFSRKS